jgi:hypothetical protein
MQVRTRTLGHDDHQTLPSVIDKNVALSQAEGMSQVANALVWTALLRKLDRLDPSFRD